MQSKANKIAGCIHNNNPVIWLRRFSPRDESVMKKIRDKDLAIGLNVCPCKKQRNQNVTVV